MIFVFGSNQAGIHGAGAAKVAVNRFGAKWGQGYGLYGQSFAIPTKDADIKVLPLYIINHYVAKFIHSASVNTHMQYYVTRIGTGLAGYSDEDIAPMFRLSPKNCHFDIAWKEILGKNFTYFEGEL